MNRHKKVETKIKIDMTFKLNSHEIKLCDDIQQEYEVVFQHWGKYLHDSIASDG